MRPVKEVVSLSKKWFLLLFAVLIVALLCACGNVVINIEGVSGSGDEGDVMFGMTTAILCRVIIPQAQK